MKKIKLGFVGYGKSTHRYHLPFIDLDRYEIIGYYTRGTRVFEMEYPIDNLIKFESLDDLLASDVELIVITTPSNAHYEYTKKALLAKKHVLVEKPICFHLEELEELHQIAQQHNLTLTPYQDRRYDSDFLTMQHALQNYDFGTVLEIKSNHSLYRPDDVSNRTSIYEGHVYSHAVHFVDQIVSYFGAPDDIIYDIYSQKKSIIDGQNISTPEDYYDITFIYNFLRIRLYFSMCRIKQPIRWIVSGTKGYFEKHTIDQQETFLKQGKYPHTDKNFGKDQQDEISVFYDSQGNQTIVPTVYGGYHLFYNQLYEHIVNNQTSPVEYKQAHTVLRILETIVLHKKWEK